MTWSSRRAPKSWNCVRWDDKKRGREKEDIGEGGKGERGEGEGKRKGAQGAQQRHGHFLGQMRTTALLVALQRAHHPAGARYAKRAERSDLPCRPYMFHTGCGFYLLFAFAFGWPWAKFREHWAPPILCMASTFPRRVARGGGAAAGEWRGDVALPRESAAGDWK